jgi:HK97 family phage portal protein
VSLIADLLDAVRGPAPRADTPPPVPYTGVASGFGFGGRDADPTERQLDLTTTESTLYSVLDLISGDVGGVDWDLYRGMPATDMMPPENAKPLTSNQHLAKKLWDQPNDFMTGDHFRTVVEWHHSAVGEGWAVCDYAAPGVPRSFWPVRPDRMLPRTDPDKFLLGYEYRGPNGERVPLEIDEVLRLTRPHPLDPHRGIGPVQSLMLPLTTSLTAQQWIEAFYRNDATPGGMIELNQDEILDDDDWKTFLTRWNEQHRGVSRAHRVGVLEIGTFKPVAIDFQKLQVTEMRHLTRDQILEAFQLNKFMLGATDDVNRAASLAANDTYARRVLHRRVKKWHAFANGPYLQCFGATGRNVMWCPENVIPEDVEAENAERDSKANAAKTFAEAGFNLEEIAAHLGLPFATIAGTSPTALAVLAQKLYLAVGKLGQPNVVLSTVEARRIMEQAGAELDPWEPTDEDDEPEPAPAPPFGPPMPPPAGEDDPDADPDEDPEDE